MDCPRCHGDTVITVRGYSIIPSSGVLGPDPQCDHDERCPDCHGTGAVEEWRGVYPGMCIDPETCRGKTHCPRDYSCCE